MIKLHPNWDLDNDKYQWILINKREGKDKDGNTKTHEDKTFHRTLDQVNEKILNEEMKAAEDLTMLLSVVNNVSRTMTKTLIESGVKR